MNTRLAKSERLTEENVAKAHLRRHEAKCALHIHRYYFLTEQEKFLQRGGDFNKFRKALFIPVANYLERFSEDSRYNLDALDIISIWSVAFDIFPVDKPENSEMRQNLAAAIATPFLTYGLNNEWRNLYEKMIDDDSYLNEIAQLDEKCSVEFEKRYLEVSDSLRQIRTFLSRRGNRLLEQIDQDWTVGIKVLEIY